MTTRASAKGGYLGVREGVRYLRKGSSSYPAGLVLDLHLPLLLFNNNGS